MNSETGGVIKQKIKSVLGVRMFQKASPA